MKQEDIDRVGEIAELKVRQYFDHFLGETLPALFKVHESGCCTKKLLKKCLWVLFGIAIGLSFAFPKLIQIIGLLG